jgi:hypothetical protein
MGRQWTITPTKQQLFLEAMAKGSTVSAACKASGIERTSAYKLRDTHPDFAAAWDDARIQGIDRMEDAALSRAVDGWDEPLVSAGKLLGSTHKYSDNLLTTLLKANRPEKYGDKVNITSHTHVLIPGLASVQEMLARYLTVVDSGDAKQSPSQALLASLEEDTDGST